MRVKYEPQVGSVKVEATHSLVFLIHTRMLCVCGSCMCECVCLYVDSVCEHMFNVHVHCVYMGMKHSKGTHV